jgi:hypothetical protein
VASLGHGPGDFLAPGAASGADAAVTGWASLTDVGFLLETSGMLVTAVLLAAAIAYHPVTRARAATLEELEQPKTFIIYALVGALVAVVVETLPAMAMVIFGIGGLMRFRTQVGQAKDTGRVILVTVVGLCCGLEMYGVALIGTVFGWVLVFWLERNTVERMVVQGLEVSELQRAATAYAEILNQSGFKVLSEKNNVKKGAVSFITRIPAGARREELNPKFAALEPELHGAIHWENS